MSVKEDQRGNKIIGSYSGEKSRVVFIGNNNTVRFGSNVTLRGCDVRFHCSNSNITIDDNTTLMANIGIGHDCTLAIGRNVTFTGMGLILLAENTTVMIGDECLIAKGVTIRSDDSHPIFSVVTKERVNLSKDITIHEKVWIGEESTIMKGISIKSGSVIGAKSVVTKNIPNNCCAAGNPAKVIKTDIMWVNKYLRSHWWDMYSNGELFYDEKTWKKTTID